MALRRDTGIVHGDTVPFPVLPCICCRKELETVMPGSENQPYAGTTFHSHGHYGSTVFDPMDGSFLEINVCDECMKSHAANNRIAFKNVPLAHARPYKFWDPMNDAG